MGMKLSKEEWTEKLEQAIAAIKKTEGQVKEAPLAGITEASPTEMPLCNRIITEDMIRLFVCATGDPNPLWTDNDYAQQTRWKGKIAPPMCEIMIAECAPTPDPIPLPGLVYMNGGSTREYHAPIRPGDVFKGYDTFLGFTEKKTDKPYRLFMQTGQRDFVNQNGEKVVTVTSNIMIKAQYPGDRVAQGPKPKKDFSEVKRHYYTPDELAIVHKSYEAELDGSARRGLKDLKWEDVTEGQDIGTLYKGPYDISDAVSFFGVTGFSHAFAIKWKGLKPIEAASYRDPETGEVHHGADWHFLDQQARNNGVPFSPTFGSHSECCLTELVTNWMGDNARIRKFSSQIRKMSYVGDVLVIKGQIARKYEEDGRKLVDLDLWVERFGTDEKAVKGNATVEIYEA